MEYLLKACDRCVTGVLMCHLSPGIIQRYIEKGKDEPPTPLQCKLNEFGMQLSKVCLNIVKLQLTAIELKLSYKHVDFILSFAVCVCFFY